MRDTVVKMKDGRVLIGPIWQFKPKEGFLTLAGENVSEKLYLCDIFSATTKIGDSTRDEIFRALEEGWNNEECEEYKESQRIAEEWSDCDGDGWE